MLGAGVEGAWQLPGRTSVVPGGHSSPGLICVPPRMPCAAMPAPIAPLKRTIRAVLVTCIRQFSHGRANVRVNVCTLCHRAGGAELFDLVAAVSGVGKDVVGVLAEERSAALRIQGGGRHFYRRAE